MAPRVEADIIQRGLNGMKIASVGPMLPVASSIAEIQDSNASGLVLFQLAAEDESDESLAPCGGGVLSTLGSEGDAPIWLTGCEAVNLEQGESAVVPCATSFPVNGEAFTVVPNTAAVCRAFRTLWDTAEGFALVANFSQPSIRLEPGT